MASRRSLNVLNPIPLNQFHDASCPLPKKRKLCADLDDWQSRNIIIRAPTASLSDDPLVLEPIAVISRSQLPFGWLDNPSPLSQIQPGSLFIANIPVLESGLHVEPLVLVARLASDGGFCVAERVKTGIYALSKLVRDVEEGDLLVAMKASSLQVGSVQGGGCASSRVGEVEGSLQGENWWQLAQIEDPNPDMSNRLPTTRARVDVVFGVDPNIDTVTKDIFPTDSAAGPDRSSSCEVPMPVTPFDSQDPSTLGSGDAVEGDLGSAMQSPQELLEGLREQYLQALYISKTSVAYFAKGPLARCRAAFQSPGSTSAESSDLVSFYREAILTAKKMDLKYRETLPSTLNDILLSVSDSDGAIPGKNKRKRKKTKKALGKSGLYPEEDGFIKRWWKGRSLTENGSSMATSREAEVKKYISDLRLRETQLQILLILEAMALEAVGFDEATPSTSKNEAPPGEGLVKSKPKSKKPHDLNVMLELHLDRLCIWHAVSFDDMAAPDATKSSGSNNPSGKTVESDAVRDFCTEVIIPFYVSRLPDRCKSITRKLGVSAGAISPFAKSSTKKTPRGKSGGAASERQQFPKHPRRRTLHRVLTDEQTASQERPRPSLSRSNTTSSQSDAKREPMNPLLPILSMSVRGGIQKAKRVENREVDLNAVARQHETKLKRVQMLADQKKELDAAILTLRKPNRELVAKDIANDADRRLTSTGSSRKPKNPVRNPLGHGVQVMATPRRGRKKDAVVGLPPLPKSLVLSSSKPNGASASFTSPFGGDGPQVIPGSAVRPTSFSGVPHATDVGAVQETPSRRPPQPFAPFNDDGVAESPSITAGTGNLFRVPRRPAPRPTDVAPSTPVTSRHVDLTDMDMGMSMGMDLDAPPSRALAPPPVFALPVSQNVRKEPSLMVMETPPKCAPVPPIHRNDGNIAPSFVVNKTAVPMTPEKSIYAQLGWDDDDDDLAL